ncbi:hypothetical protein GVO57_11065 [Sphingomonas changnyeongensis]|uniref:Uncharacterized protein n=1 Tax=Sphingomonas changnyeongensis TaxID=2698679 RepID=A0A7Z2NWR3_9SPHN|nr:hypothetical protein [Sphingomonas changnyeongensis]QHL91251.1 hypothetical protein GVO57_11065 [Sphingomonas changnyeongensis]
MSPARDAAEVRRLMARKAVLVAQLREVEARLADHGARLSRANGLVVPLKGAALARLAEHGRG